MRFLSIDGAGIFRHHIPAEPNPVYGIGYHAANASEVPPTGDDGAMGDFYCPNTCGLTSFIPCRCRGCSDWMLPANDQVRRDKAGDMRSAGYPERVVSGRPAPSGPTGSSASPKPLFPRATAPTHSQMATPTPLLPTMAPTPLLPTDGIARILAQSRAYPTLATPQPAGQKMVAEPRRSTRKFTLTERMLLWGASRRSEKDGFLDAAGIQNLKNDPNVRSLLNKLTRESWKKGRRASLIERNRRANGGALICGVCRDPIETDSLGREVRKKKSTRDRLAAPHIDHYHSPTRREVDPRLIKGIRGVRGDWSERLHLLESDHIYQALSPNSQRQLRRTAFNASPLRVSHAQCNLTRPKKSYKHD